MNQEILNRLEHARRYRYPVDISFEVIGSSKESVYRGVIILAINSNDVPLTYSYCFRGDPSRQFRDSVQVVHEVIIPYEDLDFKEV